MSASNTNHSEFLITLKGIPVVQDHDQDSTDLMKCVSSLEEKERKEGKQVRHDFLDISYKNTNCLGLRSCTTLSCLVVYLDGWIKRFTPCRTFTSCENQAGGSLL